MRFGGVRPAYCSIKPGLVWLTTFCGIAASCSVLLLTLAAFGMTNWLNDTAPAWEKRLDAAMTIWIVTLNMAIMFSLPASAVAGLNPMRVLNSRGVAWTATLPVFVMDAGLVISAIATVSIAMSATLTMALARPQLATSRWYSATGSVLKMALAHWLTLLNVTNTIGAVTVCVALWAGNRLRISSWDWFAFHGHRITLIVVALFCLTSGVACVVLTGSPDRWAPIVIATTVTEATVALAAAWLVYVQRQQPFEDLCVTQSLRNS